MDSTSADPTLAALRRIEAELAIRNLVVRYADAAGRRDADRWIDTWAEDCVWDLGRGRITHGREDTLTLWRDSIGKYPWVAQVPCSGIVEIDDDGARGHWYLLELNHALDGSGVLHLGYYDDIYVESAAGWQFAERRFHHVYKGALDPGVVVPLP